MATTRSSTGSAKSSPVPAKKANKKRSAESQSSPPAKRGRPAKVKKAKQQKAVKETTTGAENDKDVAKQINDASEEQADGNGKDGEADSTQVNERQEQENEESEDAGANKIEAKPKGAQGGEKSAFGEVKADASEVNVAAQKEQEEKGEPIANNSKSVLEDATHASAIPSSILERGVMYLFFRARVGAENPQGIENVARSYIVLHPLPLGTQLRDGPLEDSGDARLLALPNTVLPTSGKDQFLFFVEKTKTTVKEIREHFATNEYAAKTAGTSVALADQPIAEATYAITSNGRESHLAYYSTRPPIFDELQIEHGLHEKGSFICLVKNPSTPGPANSTLDNPAEYPEGIQKKFRNLRWIPLEPELLNYQNTQLLLIGEDEGSIGRVLVERIKDAKNDEMEKLDEEVKLLDEKMKKMGEELKKLEEAKKFGEGTEKLGEEAKLLVEEMKKMNEDLKKLEEEMKLDEEAHDRVKHLEQMDPVFETLIQSSDYPKMLTSWN